MQGLYSLDHLPSHHSSTFNLPGKTRFDFENESFEEEINPYNPQSSTPLTDCILSRFSVSPTSDPGRFCYDIKSQNLAPRLMDFKKGTTTLGFIYDSGVIVAVDSRASMSTYIATKSVEKALVVNKKYIGTLAGGAADCQYWLRVLTKMCRLYELRNGESISVAAASNLLTNSLFHYKGYGLSTGIMLAGYDNKGPQLYFHDETGLRLKGKLFSIGSGMVYAYGILDSEYRENMTDKEAIELGRKAIYHATHRDGGSGNYVTVYRIDKEGPHLEIFQQDVNEVHHEYCKAKGKPTNFL